MKNMKFLNLQFGTDGNLDIFTYNLQFNAIALQGTNSENTVKILGFTTEGWWSTGMMPNKKFGKGGAIFTMEEHLKILHWFNIVYNMHAYPLFCLLILSHNFVYITAALHEVTPENQWT